MAGNDYPRRTYLSASQLSDESSIAVDYQPAELTEAGQRREATVVVELFRESIEGSVTLFLEIFEAEELVRKVSRALARA